LPVVNDALIPACSVFSDVQARSALFVMHHDANPETQTDAEYTAKWHNLICCGGSCQVWVDSVRRDMQT
jgi:hypothetical protein